MRVSVVIPTLDEAPRLGGLLGALALLGPHEVIVADGGSADVTREVAEAGGARVIAAPCGRGQQLAAGAAAATGDVVWMVHADALPPLDALRQIEAALADPGVVGGAFWLHTVDDGGRWRLGPMLRIADVRSRFTRYPYGDQAIFCRRAALEAVGGVPRVALMEDLELARALWRVGRLVTVGSEVRVSGRRFADRPWFYLGVMWSFPVMWRLGVSADTLARWYRNVR